MNEYKAGETDDKEKAMTHLKPRLSGQYKYRHGRGHDNTKRSSMLKVGQGPALALSTKSEAGPTWQPSQGPGGRGGEEAKRCRRQRR